MNLFAFIRHYLSADTRYDVHSPHVYTFVTQVLPHRQSLAGKRIAQLRKQLLSDQSTIEIEDFGAGYGGNQQKSITKMVKEVAKSSARRTREGELLHRICANYQPRFPLELGTNLGVSTLYQATALKDDQVFHTIEGAPSLAKMAGKHFQEFNLQVQVHSGEFGGILKQLLSQPEFQPDYVFIDGNHRYEPVMEYFNLLLPRMRENSILILDDIRWSKGMFKAWNEIIRHPDVSVSIDLFTIGICFLKRVQAKQDFKFRFLPL